MTLFFRLVDEPVDRKALALKGLVREVRGSSASHRVFDVDPLAFAEVTASPFSYWVPPSVRTAFRFPKLEQGERTAKQGLSTTDDFRFVRLWWEVPESTTRLSRWFPFAKGGSFSLGYAPVHLVVNWFESGHEMYAFTGIIEGMTGAPMRNPQFYFRAGLTWPLRTQSGFGIRAMPVGCVFGHKGPGCFVPGDEPRELLALLAVAMSSPFRYLVEIQTAFGAYEVGVIQRTPVPDLNASDRDTLARLARGVWSLKRALDCSTETSHAFVLPMSGAGPSLGAAQQLNRSAIEEKLADSLRKLDDTAFGIFGLTGDRSTIEASLNRADRGEVSAADEEADDEVEDDRDSSDNTTLQLRSWLVGVAFGRFDPRIAVGKRALPPEPEVFDAIPSRSPGMYPVGEEAEQRADLLVDDEGHSDDVAARTRAVGERVGVGLPENLRGWLAKEFFPLHIKMYSKSRRKAPIYWQLATPSATYSVWLYIHGFSKDTIFRVQNDYVVPKLAHEERRLDSLASELREGATAAQRKQLAAQEALVEELRAFLDEVKRVAPLWKPNLDDGVIINFAPLWRLVPQNKSWQKELKSTWDALCDGKYDWAHLAMHLWPERVVPRCSKDRSLAIAHWLEDVFWVEGTHGKWTARKTPTKSVDELVRERTSPAVKSALKSLLEAPVASGAARKTKKGKANA